MEKEMDFTEAISRPDKETDEEARRWFDEKKRIGIAGTIFKMIGAFFHFYFVMPAHFNREGSRLHISQHACGKNTVFFHVDCFTTADKNRFARFFFQFTQTRPSRANQQSCHAMMSLQQDSFSVKPR